MDPAELADLLAGLSEDDDDEATARNDSEGNGSDGSDAIDGSGQGNEECSASAQPFLVEEAPRKPEETIGRESGGQDIIHSQVVQCVHQPDRVDAKKPLPETDTRSSGLITEAVPHVHQPDHVGTTPRPIEATNGSFVNEEVKRIEDRARRPSTYWLGAGAASDAMAAHAGSACETGSPANLCARGSSPLAGKPVQFQQAPSCPSSQAETDATIKFVDGQSSLALNSSQLQSFVPLIDADSASAIFAKRLRCLLLSGNHIEDANALAEPLSRVEGLTELDISCNRLQRLPLLQRQRQLIKFDASKNVLRSSRGLLHCEALKYVSLAYNQLRKVDQLETLQALEVLDISHNSLGPTPLATMRPLAACASLQELRVIGNPLAKPGKAHRGQLISLIPSLVFVDNDQVRFKSRCLAASSASNQCKTKLQTKNGSNRCRLGNSRVPQLGASISGQLAANDSMIFERPHLAKVSSTPIFDCSASKSRERDAPSIQNVAELRYAHPERRRTASALESHRQVSPQRVRQWDLPPVLAVKRFPGQRSLGTLCDGRDVSSDAFCVDTSMAASTSSPKKTCSTGSPHKARQLACVVSSSNIAAMTTPTQSRISRTGATTYRAPTSSVSSWAGAYANNVAPVAPQLPSSTSLLWVDEPSSPSHVMDALHVVRRNSSPSPPAPVEPLPDRPSPQAEGMQTPSFVPLASGCISHCGKDEGLGGAVGDIARGALLTKDDGQSSGPADIAGGPSVLDVSHQLGVVSQFPGVGSRKSCSSAARPVVIVPRESAVCQASEKADFASRDSNGQIALEEGKQSRNAGPTALLAPDLRPSAFAVQPPSQGCGEAGLVPLCAALRDSIGRKREIVRQLRSMADEPMQVQGQASY